MLKGNIDNNKNTVFSPFGYATILSILEEGANDDTSYDIRTLLKHPNDRALVRSAYRSVLSHFQGLDPDVAPQFRTWFYIYRNNTIDESFKERITKEFYVTVRDVEPMNNNEQQNGEQQTPPIAKSVEELASLKSTNVQVKPDSKPTNSKDIVQFDSYKMEAGPVDETRIDNQKDASKFDEVVEDRQYVEVPVIKNELKQEKAKLENEQEKNQAEKEKLSKNSEETKPAKSLKEKDKNDGAEKMTLPIKQYEEMEIMQADESRSGKAVSDF